MTNNLLFALRNLSIKPKHTTITPKQPRYQTMKNISRININSIPLHKIHDFLSMTDSLTARLINSNFKRSTIFSQRCDKNNLIYNVPQWNAIYPISICANISRSRIIQDDDFKYFKYIIDLNMSECVQITSDAFIHLVSLKKLNINRCRQITDDIFLNFRFDKLIELKAHYCDKLTDNIFASLPRLKTLVISYCGVGITDNGIRQLLYLTKLDISSNDRLTDNAINKLVNLKYLCVSGCPNITDDAFINLRNLTHLDISYCNWLTNDSIKHLVKLTKLNMSGCDNITDDAFESLTNLIYLNISDCTFLTNKSIAHLVNLNKLEMYGMGDKKYNNNINIKAFKNIRNLKEISLNIDADTLYTALRRIPFLKIN